MNSVHWTRSLATLLVAALIAGSAVARGRGLEADDIPRSELPAQAQRMLELIAARGPFAYDRDGVVFGNREQILPSRPRGYYHEFTVPTPGARNRGARRIVCGGEPGSTRDCYYSGDHYRSFRRIR